ncbi:MAG: hypothetical protein RLZZ163_1027, partial [Actinomycetota bacterium]
MTRHSRYFAQVRLRLLAVTVALLAGVAGISPAALADTQTARTWTGAAQLAGPDGSLWQPT